MSTGFKKRAVDPGAGWAAGAFDPPDGQDRTTAS